MKKEELIKNLLLGAIIDKENEVILLKSVIIEKLAYVLKYRGLS